MQVFLQVQINLKNVFQGCHPEYSPGGVIQGIPPWVSSMVRRVLRGLRQIEATIFAAPAPQHSLVGLRSRLILMQLRLLKLQNDAAPCGSTPLISLHYILLDSSGYCILTPQNYVNYLAHI
jgi:hypothetical protein